MAKFEINESGVKALYDEIGHKLKAVDSQLRAEYIGEPVETVAPNAAKALGRIGVHLPDTDLRAYAESIRKNTDFLFNLG